MVAEQNFVYVPNKDICRALSAFPLIGKRMIPPFDGFSERPFGIVEDHELVVGIPEIHMREDDLWIGLEGEAVFILGGQLVGPLFRKLPKGGENQNEISGESIIGGREVIVRAGDVLWIPAGIPHMHTASGTARLFIYKNPRRNKVAKR